MRYICMSVLLLGIVGAACLAQDSYVVLDRASHRGLYLVDPGGTITSLTPTVPWEYAHSVARDRDGNFIVTVDVYGTSGSNGVYRVSPDGQITTVVTFAGYARPRGIAIDATGNYVVLNQTSEALRQVLRISPAGQVEVLHEGPPLLTPMAIAIDGQGNYIIAVPETVGRDPATGFWSYAYGAGAVYRFNPITRQMTTIRSSVDENGYFRQDTLGCLVGIAIDGDGNYILVDAPVGLGREHDWHVPSTDTWLTKMRPDGEILQEIRIPALDNLWNVGLDVAIDSRGDYIVADALGISNDQGRLFRVTPSGTVTTIVRSTILGEPGGVVVLTNTVVPPPYHAADYQEPRWVMDGTEVNRVLAYWRAGAYHVDAAGLDGYGAGTGSTNGPLHSADYRDPRWMIDGAELNRVLSYWRAGGYHVDTSGLDGYAPGTN